MKSTLSQTRLVYLDNLRVFTMLSVLAVHCIALFINNYPANWQPAPSSFSFYAIIALMTLVTYTMPLFFLIAGLAASLLQEKYSTPLFLKKRAARLLIPWLIGMLLLSYFHFGEFSISVLSYCQNQTLASCFQQFTQLNSQQKLTAIKQGLTYFNSMGSLWFLYYLFLLYLLQLLCEQLKRLPGINQLNQHIWLLFIIILSLGVTIFLGPWYLLTPESLIPNLWFLVFYAAFYYLGFYWHRYETEIWQKKYLIISFLSLAAFMLVILQTYMLKHWFWPMQLNPQLGVLFHLGMTTVSWLTVISIFQLFKRYLNQTHKIILYLAEASYWIYLTQIPVILLLQYWLKKTALDNTEKVIIIYLGCIGILLIIYHLLVRSRWLGKIINGRKN